tara:strand:+ start:660 stop:2405 length:1746 start_codon:yes stop_codon:yes gene_type:complete
LKNYPEKITKLIDNAISSNPRGYLFDYPYTYPNEKSEAPNSIKLASHAYEIEKGKINWNKIFNDPEDTMSIHRWNWLTYLNSDSKCSNSIKVWAISEINNWISNFQYELKKTDFQLNKLIHWSSYTVGERISNGILFFFLNNLSPTKKIEDSIFSQVRFLIRRLEYFEDETGNHIINNARAIYLAGVVFNCLEWREYASSIINCEIDRLVTPDGFLREGSSHYQYLFTRWICEIFLFAMIIKDKELIKILENKLNKLLKSCAFFEIYSDIENEIKIPFIGDISPDFDPDWLIQIPFLFCTDKQNKKRIRYDLKDWCELFISKINLINESNSYLRREKNDDDQVIEYPESGWFKYNKNLHTVFIRSDKKGIPDYVGHHHIDAGHFSLYYYDNPIFIDQGRLTYKSFNGVNAEAHNILTLDGVGISPLINSRFPNSYSQFQNDLVSEQKNDLLEINFTTNGFKRVSPSLIWKRKIIINEKSFEIIDIIDGENKHSIKTYFHWAPDIKIELTNNDKINFYNKKSAGEFSGPWINNNNISINIGNNCSIGRMVNAYGQYYPSDTLEVISEVSLPIKMNYKILWKK